MSILFNSISSKPDYSILFSGLNRSGSSNSNSFYGINLADYTSIKSGSYGKLLKAYYQKVDGGSGTGTSSAENKDTISSVTKTKVDATVKKELTEIRDYATEVSESANVLMQKGTKSVFTDGDMSKIYDAVSNFTEDYNTLVDKGQDSPSGYVVRDAKSLAYIVEGYEQELKEIGITITGDKQLTLDKETFMKAEPDKVEEIFSGRNSLSYQVSTQAVAMGNKAYSESNKSNLYTANATYNSYTAGAFFNGIV